MSGLLESALHNALAGMTKGPRPLRKAMEFYAAQESGRLPKVEEQLAKRVGAGANDAIRNRLRMALSEWDWEQDAPWTLGTEKVSADRRSLIYRLLAVGRPLQNALDKLPYYHGQTEIFIEAPGSAGDWYTSDFRATHDFYWKRLRSYLVEHRKFSADAVSSLGSKAARVMTHLGNPADAAVRASRGLVVGHVQSGKTTNFTAVIAKAIDAGYRLIIVLSGTTNLLRNQTQRRLDMELVGYENVLRHKDEGEEHDYSTDPAWPDRFIRYMRLPSLLGSVDILRLTGREDFQSQSAGINPLEFEFEKREKAKPLFDRENLDHASARLVIVKKQKDRLQKLCKLLRGVGTDRCKEIPALIIDDESDQASVNTLNPNRPRKGKDEKERTAINGYIVDLLNLLRRAQYIGYTATPFANCFVKPDDPADIYPSNFMVSLERPQGYMGASDFHDFQPVPAGRMSNEGAHVRGIPRDGMTDDRLLAEAIDAFVLTAAIKEFRAARGKDEFSHHTMLVHDSPLQGEHEATAAKIRELWKAAGYDSPRAAARLWALLVRDFKPVWEDRGAGLPFPRSLNQLLPHLGSALGKIRKASDPVLIVNSAEGADVPDFDKTSVWKIIVGGTKLSRGYTVEGLTISYFRRRSRNQDTLMQMGRWFGFRPSYRDLVRLYIGRREPDGKRPPFDLYKAFEALCRDEEDFREQLQMYESGADGKPALTPRDVPALVFNSHPRLRPTAANKMFNAKLTWAAFTYREPTQQAMEVKARKRNEREFADLLSTSSLQTAKASVEMTGKSVTFDVKWRSATNDQVLKLLEKLDWGTGGRQLTAETEFLRKRPPAVKEWSILVPQLIKVGAGVWKAGRNEFRCVERARQATRFGGFSSPEHVTFAKWLVGRAADGVKVKCPSMKQRDTRGALLVYPTVPSVNGKLQDGPPVMGFALVLPDVPSAQRIAFTTYRKSDKVVVTKGRTPGEAGPKRTSRGKKAAAARRRGAAA